MAIDTIKATAILDGAIDTADLADGAVTTAKITDGEVTDAKIASGITSSKLTGALPAIDGSSLTSVDPADGSVTTAKLDSTLDLSGKTVTFGLSSGDLPSGTVVQQKMAEYTTAHTISSSGNIISDTITTQGNTDLYVTVSVPRYVNASGTWGKAFHYFVTLDGGSQYQTEHVGANATGEEAWHTTFTLKYGNVSAGSHTIAVTGAVVISANNHQINRSPRYTTMVLQEVAR